MNKYTLLFILSLFAFLPACTKVVESEDESVEEAEVHVEYGIPVDSFSRYSSTVEPGETLGGLLKRLGASSTQISQLAGIQASDFDVRRFVAGKKYIAFYSRPDSVLTYLVYCRTATEDVVLHLSDSLHVERQQKEIRCEMESASVVIESSLWEAMDEAGKPVQLALELSDVYQWTVNFFSLQKGDSIRAYYEHLYVDSMSLGVGRIVASKLYHGGKWVDAYYFDPEQFADSMGPAKAMAGYYSHDGLSQKKAFLKAPLNYKRISSTFTYHRKHPIFGVVRPHTAVDYAAPAGTPVVTIGDGEVISMGYQGGGGNTVKIRHNATYETAYLHLQGFAKGLKVGKHVAQGELIGYVGSTGHSTGPHLDFRVWKNGTPVDPLRLESPSTDPIPVAYKERFIHYADSLQYYLIP